MWKLQICRENEDIYHNYIVDTPKDIYKNSIYIGKYLYAGYFGSSTRIDEIGTFYYVKTGIKHKLKLRLLDDDNNIIFNHQLTDDDINNLANLNNNRNLNNTKTLNDLNSHKIHNVEIHYRDLYRWENYPYEISGITIYK